jgi:hypothetical protein
VIRRLPLAAASVAVAALLTSGCSTFSRNDAAAEVNGHELAINDLDDLSRGFASVTGDSQYIENANDEFSGPALRAVIGRWIGIQALLDGLADEGYTLDASLRDTARSELEASDPAMWETVNATTQQLLVDFRASSNALAAETDKPSDEKLGDIYLAGVRTSGLLCIRVIFADNQDTADAVTAQLEAGGSFADIADQTNPDDAGTAAGGAIADPETGQQCVLSTDVPSAVVDALADLPIGKASEAIHLGVDQVVFVQQRELSEISADLRTTLNLNAVVLNTFRYSATADVFVDSRYGMWDDSVGQVVPTR